MTAAAHTLGPEAAMQAMQTPDMGLLKHHRDKERIEHQTFKVGNAAAWQLPACNLVSMCSYVQCNRCCCIHRVWLANMRDTRHKQTVCSWAFQAEQRAAAPYIHVCGYGSVRVYVCVVCP